MKKIVIEFPDDSKEIEIEAPKDYNSLKEKIEELEKDILQSYIIQYIDEEDNDDKILITNNSDYKIFLESNITRINFFEKNTESNTTITFTDVNFTDLNNMTRVNVDELENKNNEITNLNNRLKELENNHKI